MRRKVHLQGATMIYWQPILAQPEAGFGGGGVGGTATAIVFVAFLPVLLALPWSMLAGWFMQPAFAKEVDTRELKGGGRYQPPGVGACIVFMCIKEFAFFFLAILLTVKFLPKSVGDWGWQGWLVQFVSYGVSWTLFVTLMAVPTIPWNRAARAGGLLAIVDAPLNFLPYLLFVGLNS